MLKLLLKTQCQLNLLSSVVDVLDLHLDLDRLDNVKNKELREELLRKNKRYPEL
jgi:hypothetical protein